MPLISKITKQSKDKKRQRLEDSVLGICIYAHEYPIYAEESPRNIGFIQYPSDAPTDVEDDGYWPDEI